MSQSPPNFLGSTVEKCIHVTTIKLKMYNFPQWHDFLAVKCFIFCLYSKCSSKHWQFFKTPLSMGNSPNKKMLRFNLNIRRKTFFMNFQIIRFQGRLLASLNLIFFLNVANLLIQTGNFAIICRYFYHFKKYYTKTKGLQIEFSNTKLEFKIKRIGAKCSVHV